jgi:hypothetical protein
MRNLIKDSGYPGNSYDYVKPRKNVKISGNPVEIQTGYL